MKIYWCTTCLVVVVLLGVMSNAQDIEPPNPWTQKPVKPHPSVLPTQRRLTQHPWTQNPWTQKPRTPQPIKPHPTHPPTQNPWTQHPWTQKPRTPTPIKPYPTNPPTQNPWTQKPWTQKIWPNFPTIPPTQKPVNPVTQKPWTPKPSWSNFPTTPETPINNWVPSNEIVEMNVSPPRPSLNCGVDSNVKITCGHRITSADKCSAINCCFDGQRCFYGKMVTVQATKAGSFVVVVSKEATVPALIMNSVRLRDMTDPRCNPVASNSAFIVFHFPVQSCGTSVSESSGAIIYDNSLVSSYEITNGPNGMITRDSFFSLVFRARYTGLYAETLMVKILTKKDPLDVVEQGPIKVDLRLANGVCSTKAVSCTDQNKYYTSYYATSAYPITIVLREPVPVEVRILDKTDPGMVLLLNRCWATNGPQPHSMPQWDLLIDGCPNPNDNHKYLTTKVQVANVPLPSLYQRFVVRMFTFIDPQSKSHLTHQVYFHCSATVCHSAVANCQQACQRKRRDISDVSDSPSTSTGVVVSSGAINLIEGAAVELQ